MAVTSSFNKAAVAAVAFAATGTQAYRLGGNKDPSDPLQEKATKIKKVFENCSRWEHKPKDENAMKNMGCVIVQEPATERDDTQTCINNLDDIEIAAADIATLYEKVHPDEKPKVRCHLAGMEHIKKEIDTAKNLTFKEDGTTVILFRVTAYLDAKARELKHNLTPDELEEDLKQGAAQGFVAADGEVETEIKQEESGDMDESQRVILPISSTRSDLEQPINT